MMMALRTVLFLCLMFPFAAMAEEPVSAPKIIVDLAQPHVDITTGFVGGQLELFGVRKEAGDIAVILRGPQKNMQVRRKGNVLGAWINTDKARYDNVPTYYDYALNEGFAASVPADQFKLYGIAPENIRVENHTHKGHKAEECDLFFQALLRNKQNERLFGKDARSITFLDNSFFKVIFKLPDNVPIGLYEIEVLYFKNGVLEDRATKSIKVAQVGTSGEIHSFSNTHALAYGVLCVFLAVFAGWISNRLRKTT